MYQNRVFKRPFDERLKALFGTGFDALVWWPIALIELGSRFLCLLKGEQTSVRSPLFFVVSLVHPNGQQRPHFDTALRATQCGLSGWPKPTLSDCAAIVSKGGRVAPKAD